MRTSMVSAGSRGQISPDSRSPRAWLQVEPSSPTEEQGACGADQAERRPVRRGAAAVAKSWL